MLDGQGVVSRSFRLGGGLQDSDIAEVRGYLCLEVQRSELLLYKPMFAVVVCEVERT